MRTFLDRWDMAVRAARISGEQESVRRYHRAPADPRVTAYLAGFTVVARTMHPSFMAPPMPKHDPVRDLVPAGDRDGE